MIVAAASRTHGLCDVAGTAVLVAFVSLGASRSHGRRGVADASAVGRPPSFGSALATVRRRRQLNYETGVAELLWQFAFPLVGDETDMERADVANKDGGTVELLADGHAFVQVAVGRARRRRFALSSSSSPPSSFVCERPSLARPRQRQLPPPAADTVASA